LNERRVLRAPSAGRSYAAPDSWRRRPRLDLAYTLPQGRLGVDRPAVLVQIPFDRLGSRQTGAKSFTIDGEAAVVGADGIAMFEAPHRRHKATDAMLYAFGLLALNGEDLRPLPLSERKAKLEKLLARSPVGIVFNEHIGEDGATVFRHACVRGLEGIVSKRLTAPYRSGPSRDWIKVKNPDSPAMRRARAGTWQW
jgi:hypothetical protein